METKTNCRWSHTRSVVRTGRWRGARFLPVMRVSHLLQLPGTFPHNTKYCVCMPQDSYLVHQACSRDQPLSSSATQEKTCLRPCWDSELEAEVKGGFFSLTYSQITALLEKWEWKSPWRSLPDALCLVKTPADANALKPMPPVPGKGHSWSRLWRGKG